MAIAEIALSVARRLLSMCGWTFFQLEAFIELIAFWNIRLGCACVKHTIGSVCVVLWRRPGSDMKRPRRAVVQTVSSLKSYVRL